MDYAMIPPPFMPWDKNKLWKWLWKPQQPWSIASLSLSRFSQLEILST